VLPAKQAACVLICWCAEDVLTLLRVALRLMMADVMLGCSLGS
jgi:hypothetical protein